MTDELEQRLRASDPAPPTRAVDPARTPRARDLMERVMTDLDPSTPIPIDGRPTRSPRPGRLLVAAAAVALVAGVGAIALNGGDDQRTTARLAIEASNPVVMGSCLALTPDVLAEVDAAFDGTVTDISGDEVTLAVSRWFTGGDADDVVIRQDPGAAGGNQTATVYGVEFAVGERYLVTATAGLVNGCGWSGPYDADLEAIFEQAFSS